MTKTYLFLLLFITSSSLINAQDRAFKLYNAKGKEAKYDKIIEQLSETDILFIGEYHNNPISHWLELEITKSISSKKQVVLGAEMFERDNQQQLNAYLHDSIDYKTLDSTARLWQNYKTDYAPLVDFAKQEKIPFIATNIPRRYAKQVYKGGFEILDSLTLEEKKYIAPLPIPYDSTLKCYADMLNMMPTSHGGNNLPKAQAIKDATMAYSILENYKEGTTFIHYNGAYHSNYHQGICWYIKQTNPSLKTMTIATVSQADINKLEKDNHQLADYIIVVDEDMTTTY